MTAATLYQPVREVRLYGVLAQKFGRVHHLAVASAREAIQALCVVLPGFEAHLLKHSAPGYNVFVGRRARGHDVAEADLGNPLASQAPICVVPVVAGSKRGGVFQTILGAVLVTVGVVTGNPYLINIGAQLVIGGVLQMLSSPKKTSTTDKVENKASFGFDGPVNTDEEGLPVPVAIGRFLVGGARISAGISTDELPLAAAGAGAGGMGAAVLPVDMPLDPVNDLRQYEEHA